MGAIIGGMYASGSKPRAPRSLGLLQPLVVLRASILQTATIRETEVNALGQ